MRKIIFTAIMLIVIGTVGLAFSWKSDFKTKDTLIEKKIASSGINDIFVKSDVAKIIVSPSETDQFEVKLTGKVQKSNKPYLDVRKEGEKIIIEQKQNHKKINFNFGFNEVKLQIAVPKKDYRQLQVISNVGSLNIEQINAKNVDLTGDVGSINVKNMNSEQFAITASTGSIKVNEVNSDKIKIISDVGSVDVRNSESDMHIQSETGSVYVKQRTLTKPLTIKSDVGSIKIDLEEKPKDAFFDVSSDVGSVKIFGKKGTALIGNGNVKITLTSEVGSIRVQEK